MSNSSLSQPAGHIFEPALQDISLKRFRLRYSTHDDCYYLHWENPVCRALAKHYGLEEGLYQSSGIQRFETEGSKQLSYLGCTKEANQATLEWVLDFSACGLVIHQLAVKARCYYDDAESVSFHVQGDENMRVSPQLGDQHVNLNCLAGCSRVSLALTIDPSSGESVKLFPTLADDEETPLDIIVELMCPRKDDEIYAGELLLGMKYSSGNQPISRTELESLSVTSLSSASEGVDGVGHLQVHVVEGAGIVDEETHKPFNTICKCELLPSSGKHGGKHTSPRHNAYPTWAQQFDFEGLSKQDILNGGLEVILYDHHKFSSDSNIGGLRMCLPRKKLSPLVNDYSPCSSPSASRGSSPAPPENGDFNSDGSMSPLFTSEVSPLSQSPKFSITLPRAGRQTNRRSLPSSASMQTVSNTHLSPEVLRRAPSPDVRSSSATLSPNIIRRSRSSSSSAAKHKFRLSGSHLLSFLSPSSSPHSSPVSRRKIFSRHNSVESDYIHWWMEDTPTPEVKHWKRMIEKDGEWVYFWHLIRPKLKSAY